MSESEICLIVVFNHRYDGNIDKLEKIYANRFKNILFLVPSYDGNKSNVIPVYIKPELFQGFFIQAFEKFFDDKYSHYVFLADDLVLNQNINAENILNELKLEKDSAFIKYLTPLPDQPLYWGPLVSVMMAINRNFTPENSKQLPDIKTAIDSFHKSNLKIQPSDLRPRINILECLMRAVVHHLGRTTLLRKTKMKGFWPMPYPLAMGYSDFVIVPASSIRNFCRYCGMFAIMDVFVEVAVPTSLVLSCEKINTENKTVWKGTEIWGERERERIEELCHYNLKNLYGEFKNDQLYIHPVKLSKWNVESI